MPKQRTRSKTKEEQEEATPALKTRRKKTREERRATRAKRSSTKQDIPQYQQGAPPMEKPAEVSEISEILENTETLQARQNLLFAVLSKDKESIPNLIEELKKHSPNINYKEGKDHSTLLHRCVIQGGCSDVIQILLDNKANIDSADISGRTPLHICARKGDIKTLNLLLEHGANPMPKTVESQTPLHEAASAGHLDCIQSLINHHVLINLRDVNGLTALHCSVMLGHVQCVEYLIEKQANVLSRTNEGQRPIDVVEKEDDPKHKNKQVYTASGKTIYRILKKAGGNKTTDPGPKKLSVGSGVLGFPGRKSLDHRSSVSPRKRIQTMNSTISVTNGNNAFAISKQGPIKFERKEELLSMEVENEKKLETPEREYKPINIPDVKVDRHGFYIDEENPAPEPVTNKKQHKKILIKEEHRALKWISIIQNEPVVSDMNALRKNKKILKLCDQGIPDSVRGQVWKYLAGVGDRDNEIYYKLLEKADWVPEIRDQIYRDINRTMPRHILFQEKGQGQTMLTNVLLAYSSYRQDVGYCQGMGFITAMFLMYLPEEDAFWLLDQLGGDEFGFGRLWEEQMVFLKQCMSTFAKLLEAKYPKIVEKYNDNGIPIQAFTSQFFITGYMYNLPFNIAARVWDSFWLRKFEFLYAIGLAIMKISKERILGLGMEGLMSFFQFKENEIPFTTEQLIDVSVSIWSKMKWNTIQKWEKEYAETIAAEQKQLEARRAKMESLEADRKARLEEKRLEEEGSGVLEDSAISNGKKNSIATTTDDTFAQIETKGDLSETADEFSAMDSPTHKTHNRTKSKETNGLSNATE